MIKKNYCCKKEVLQKKAILIIGIYLGAGHIRTGETIFEGAIRELKEELGIKIREDELHYITKTKSMEDSKNLEFGYVYLLKCNNKVDDYTFENNEVSEVKYVYFEELEKMVKERVKALVMHDEEYKKLFKYIKDNIK